MIYEGPSARRILTQLMKPLRFDGRRSLVPLFGSGLNQAAGLGDNWQKLLSTVRASLGSQDDLPEPQSSLAKWEGYLRRYGKQNGVPAARAERALQSLVAGTLKQRTISDTSNRFYREVLELGFGDILTLNFDLALDRSADKFSRRQNVSARQHEQALYRHSRTALDSSNIITRIWHLHGDVMRTDTIKLGTRMYGMYIHELEKARQSILTCRTLYESDRRARQEKERLFLETAKHVIEREYPTWLDILFHSPVLCIGASLCLDEWPLWWALHERARYVNLLGRDIPAYCVCIGPSSDSIPAWLRGEPARIRVLLFQEHQDFWDAFLAMA